MKLTNLLMTAAIALALPSMGSAHGDHSDRRHDRHERPRHQTQTITLDREDVRQLNQTGRLGLKRAIKNIQTLGKNTQLVSVTVTGRARGGMTMVSLKVDGSIVDSERMRSQHRHDDRRRRGDHHRGDHRRPLSTVVLNNSGRYSEGAWRLLADQDIRVRTVSVTVRKKTPQRHRTNIKLGSFKVDKFIGSSKTFHISHRNVSAITLQSLSNSVDVEAVWVNYANGSSERIWNLAGYIGEGRSKTERLVNNRRNRIIRSITVEATSNDLHGSRSNLVVSAQINDVERPRRRR